MTNYVVDWSTSISVQLLPCKPKVVPQEQGGRYYYISNTVLKYGQSTQLIIAVKNVGCSNGTGFVMLRNYSNIDFDCVATIMILSPSISQSKTFTLRGENAVYITFPINKNSGGTIKITLKPVWSEVKERTTVRLELATGHVE